MLCITFATSLIAALSGERFECMSFALMRRRRHTPAAIIWKHFVSRLMLWIIFCVNGIVFGGSSGASGSSGWASAKLPVSRKFLEFPLQEIPEGILSAELRVLQLNMLADGLSGLRDDRGFFSRVTQKAIDWDYRKDLLLNEILQYNPDIITLQENDHYYDFFLPKMNALGYDCFFAPKPASACLEVSDRSDGCSLFLRRDKLKTVSTQTGYPHHT